MSFDPNSIILSPSDWFSTNIEYQGRGRAEFLDPQGVVEGPVKIRFDEFGESSIEMELEKVETEQPLRFGLMQLFSGEKPVKEGDSVRLSIGMKHNPCTRLTVTTLQGIFSATENIHYGYRLGDGATLDFHLLRSQFDVAGAGVAKYWVLPVSNFLSDFVQHHPDLDRHPLRIYPTPSVPDGLPERAARIAALHANRKNRLIIFQFNDALGFIEPLADFEERKSRLLAGRERNTITAVMVGEVGSKSIDFSDLEQWFPFDFLHLLGLATGTEVGAPWIEFRAAQGELVRRIHTNLGHPLFSKGHAAIREDIHRGTGYLLSQSQSSPHYGKSYLSVALKRLIRSGTYSFSVEDRLSHLFRGLDGLCEQYSTKKGPTLSKNYKHAVDSVIRNATKDIRNIARQAKNEGNQGEAELLSKIGDQVSRAKTAKPGFNKYLIALMEKFGLHDPAVIARHYKANPRPDNRNWPEVLAYYRGIVMHVSYFDFLGGKHEIEDLLRIVNHLHDILVRIIFNMLGYDGTYQPTVISMITDMPVDWVKPDLPASRLGY